MDHRKEVGELGGPKRQGAPNRLPFLLEYVSGKESPECRTNFRREWHGECQSGDGRLLQAN